MKLVQHILFTLLFLSSCQSHPSSEDSHAEKSVFIDSLEAVLNAKIPQWQAEYLVPCVGVGILQNGKTRLVKVYGEHQMNRDAPVNTIFNVASLTKTIVTMATLKLVEEGEWDLDEPLYHYWIDPDVQEDTLHRQLTTRHVLSHTTGFKNWRRMHPENKLAFDFHPGERFQYSGEGFEYLAAALESKFDLKLDRLVDSLVFTPFEMEDATLRWLEEEDTMRFAHWYDGEGRAHDAYYKTHWVSAADDLLITVDDLLKFAMNALDSSIFSLATLEEMKTPHAEIHQNAHQGLGWTVVEGLPEGEYVINHDGGDIGVATSMVLFPKSHSGIVVFTNADNGRIVCNNIIRSALTYGENVLNKLYWGRKIPDPLTLPDSLLAEYAGTYQTNLDRKISFVLVDSLLQIHGEGIPKLLLYPENQNTFFPLDFEIQIVFRRDREGIVRYFELIRGENIDILGEKISP